jgi:signal peptidase I
MLLKVSEVSMNRMNPRKKKRIKIMAAEKNVKKENTAKAADTASRSEKAAKIKKKIERSERSVKDYQSFLIRFGAFVAAMWLLFFVFIGIMHMPSTDMYPRVDAGDFILYYRLDKDVRAQDIIVVEKNIQGAGKQLFVSRVVAVAGDTVEITSDNRLSVNGNIMIETNIFYQTPRYESDVQYPLTLGEGECFVLADSRNGGTDSRSFGPVKAEEINGTVITIIRRNKL